MTGPVVALVLAAGGSTRLGRPKQLEQVDGRALIGYAVHAAAAADEVVVLTGAHAAEVEEVVSLMLTGPGAVAVLRVPDWSRGMGHVLACGVRAVQKRAGAVVVLLADQPGVGVQAVHAVAARWRAGAGPVVTAAYAGRPGHPRLFDAAVLHELAVLDGDRGAIRLLTRHPVTLVEVTGSDLDVDDEESLAHVRAAARALPCRHARWAVGGI